MLYACAATWQPTLKGCLVSERRCGRVGLCCVRMDGYLNVSASTFTLPTAQEKTLNYIVMDGEGRPHVQVHLFKLKCASKWNGPPFLLCTGVQFSCTLEEPPSCLAQSAHQLDSYSFAVRARGVCSPSSSSSRFAFPPLLYVLDGDRPRCASPPLSL